MCEIWHETTFFIKQNIENEHGQYITYIFNVQIQIITFNNLFGRGPGVRVVWRWFGDATKDYIMDSLNLAKSYLILIRRTSTKGTPALVARLVTEAHKELNARKTMNFALFFTKQHISRVSGYFRCPDWWEYFATVRWLVHYGHGNAMRKWETHNVPTMTGHKEQIRTAFPTLWKVDTDKFFTISPLTHLIRLLF